MTRGRTDANHGEIVKALRQVGASVQDLSQVGGGCPDIAVGHHGLTLMLEIKDGAKAPSARKLTPDQAIWHNNWQGHVAVVSSVDEAMDALNKAVRVMRGARGW